MRVPFINYQAQLAAIEGPLRKCLDEVIFERSDFIMRDDLRRFEENFARFVGSEYAVGVKSCTDGLELCLRAWGVGPGDEVITVGHTFVATLAAIAHVGATPVLVDINEEDLMDTQAVAAKVSERTRVLLPVHLNGRICEMEPLWQLARQHNLLLLEDSAQALGASYQGRGAGSLGDAGCFSFFPAKLLGGMGDGGAVTTSSPELAARLKLLRDHGRATKNDIAFYAFNSRLDNLQAAVLDLKLGYLPAWLERRRELAALYQEKLQGLPLKLPPRDGPGRHDVFQNYAVHTPRRDALGDYLRERGVETLISWPKPIWENAALGLSGVGLPQTERLCHEVISLPMNSELEDAQVLYVCECVHDFYAG